VIAEKLQEILSDVKEIKSEIDLQRDELEVLLSEETNESEQLLENSIEQSETQNILDQLEEPTNISALTGLQKTRAVQQKIELQNLKGQSLSTTMPDLNDRAVFRVVFQILFQAQRLVEQLAAYTLIEAKELQMVVEALNDALMVGAESTRLSEEQKSTITELVSELEGLKIEFQKSILEQSAEKIKGFENSLEEKIQLMNQWMEPYFGIFEN
jgi:hypothetical protein